MSKVEEGVKEFKMELYKEISIAILVILTLSSLNYAFSCWEFKNDKNFELVAAMIGLLGVFAGFLVISFSITIANINNQLNQKSPRPKEADLNQYWEYVVGVFKPLVYFHLVVISLFSLLLTGITTSFKYSNAAIPFVILLTFYLLHYSVKTVAIFLLNPFRESN